MIPKSFFAICLGLTISFSQTSVNISGTVRDSRTTAPIVGATAKLQSLLLNANTDTGGHFTLTGTSGLHKVYSHLDIKPMVNPRNILYRHAATGPILIRILNLFGKQQALVFSGQLADGEWNISPPSLLPGIYLCAFDTPHSRQTIRFLVSMHTDGSPTRMSRGAPDVSVPVSPAIGKQSAASVDTLWVSKVGYRTARVAMDSYQQSGLNILLEDTSVASPDDATIIPDPSWTCYMPDGIPPPALGIAAFSITFQINAIHNVGLTKFGQRRQYDIKGGTVTGSQITATVLTGGLDYELMLSNGSTEVEQINILRAGSTPILMRNAGVAPIGGKNVRVVLDFEAPTSSSYTWLNTGKFAATRIVDTVAKTIRMDVYDISKIALTSTRVQIKDPAGVTNQTWECVKLTGSQGTTVFTENVTLGASVTIGASKRGSRNIIPITGGTTTGRVVGKILNGGADYQLSGLDARYTLAPNDGEFIIVRNCGSGGLVPVFEARVAGPYNFLNENKYLSSSPNTGSGGVSITSTS